MPMSSVSNADQQMMILTQRAEEEEIDEELLDVDEMEYPPSQ